MAERDWFLLSSEGWDCALKPEWVWGFLDAESPRWAGQGPVLAVLEYGEQLVGLPCSRANLVQDRRVVDPEADRGGLCRDRLAACGAGVLDPERLYTALGIL